MWATVPGVEWLRVFLESIITGDLSAFFVEDIYNVVFCCPAGGLSCRQVVFYIGKFVIPDLTTFPQQERTLHPESFYRKIIDTLYPRVFKGTDPMEYKLLL